MTTYDPYAAGYYNAYTGGYSNVYGNPYGMSAGTRGGMIAGRRAGAGNSAGVDSFSGPAAEISAAGFVSISYDRVKDARHAGISR